MTCSFNNECSDSKSLECGIPTECQCNNASSCSCPNITSENATDSNSGSRYISYNYGHERKIFLANETSQHYCICTKTKYYNSQALTCESQKIINKSCDFDYECRLDQGLTCVSNTCK